jgi:hypothetical protein
MNRGIKIIAGVTVFLGVISLIFLLTAKNKTQNVVKSKTALVANSQVNQNTVSAQNKSAQSADKKAPSQADAQKKKVLAQSQWQQCKDKTLSQNAILFWDVRIFEGIPTGGSYAKGTLNSDPSFPVRVTVKSDGQFVDKINALLIPDKNVSLRGKCFDVATDGAVILQTF